MECSGQVLPQAEICDGVDNDCDGYVDDGLDISPAVDIVFVMDNSGSMADVANSIAMSVTGFSVRYAAVTTIHWAIVAAPPETPRIQGQNWVPVVGPTLISDFTDASRFATLFLAQKATSGAGEEPTLDAMHRICSGDFGLTWTQGAKKVIVMISDEMPQSYTQPYKTVQSVVTACNGYTVLLFVNATDSDWRSMASGLNATLRDVRSPALPQELTNLVDSSLCR
jgi:hypothetical protein